jgi:hypothetical protein
MRPYLKKNPLKKKGWWSGSRSEALSSNPVLQKKKKKKKTKPGLVLEKLHMGSYNLESGNR